MGDSPEDIIPTIEQTKQMTYLNQVIKETLRIHNPLCTTPSRVAAEDVELNGTFIPKGTLIDVDIYNLHRNPKYWKDPETFNPNRFAPGGEADNHSTSGYPWFAFSNGGRQCIGMNFSMVQQRVVLSMLCTYNTLRVSVCVSVCVFASTVLLFSIRSVVLITYYLSFTSIYILLQSFFLEIVRKYTFTLPEDSLHKERIQKRGVVFSIVSLDEMKVNFKGRY